LSVSDVKGRSVLEFKGCNGLTIFVSSATDYNGKLPYEPLDLDLDAACEKALAQVMPKPYAKIKSDSIALHSEPFNRVQLKLGSADRRYIPTDQRIAASRAGEKDEGLAALLYQYGRYLLICSTRPGTQTGGLQGIWTASNSCPWRGDYHININQQMNYWPAESGNLAEFTEPFYDLIEGLLPAGRAYAKELGCRGFMSSHTTDGYYYVSLLGQLKFGMWVVSGAWCADHFMEHYRFTGDKEFLRNRAYPLLKECSLFFLDWLVENPETGELVSGPTSSPENKFVGGSTCMGPAMDQEIIQELFVNYLEAVEELQAEDPMVAEVQDALSRLAMPKIGSDGRVLEWADEVEEVHPHHRHISHLYAVFPGSDFNWINNKKYWDASQKSISTRAKHWAEHGGSVGWASAWTINFYARLLDAEKAYHHVHNHLGHHVFVNLFNDHGGDGGGPFQLDGNGGFSSGIAEMLLQSHLEELHLLPVLPEAWSEGSVTGLCGRGGFEVDMVWKNKALVSGRVLSKLGKPCTIRYQNKTVSFPTQKGKSYDLARLLSGLSDSNSKN
jgi:alpha-L-fucosidase 2